MWSPRVVLVLLFAVSVLAFHLPATALSSSGVIAPGSRYVSMGSSYAAGPGVGTYDTTSGGCDRSKSNYAQQLAQRHQLQLVDVSCSGATTYNILTAGQNGFARQIDAVTANTSLVTVLIGGNDVSYVANLDDYSCQDTGHGCSVVSDATVDQQFAALPASLNQVINQTRARAPQAKIVIVGYLQAVPESGNQTCVQVPMTTADAAKMHSVASRLANCVSTAASVNNISVVRSAVIGNGHDACSTTPYVAGYTPATSPGWSGPVPYHPNQAGMDQIANALDTIVFPNTTQP